MTIEHKTTHGPHSPGQLAADWMLETGHVARVIGPRTEVSTGIRLAVRAEDQDLTLESAAALRDALVIHLQNMGWDDPDTMPGVQRTADGAGYESAPAGLPDHLQPARPYQPHGVFNIYQAPAAPADVVKVAESVRDAYADNARTITTQDVPKFTDQEVAEIAVSLTWAPESCWWLSAEGIRYTPSAAAAIKSRALKMEAEDAKLTDMEAEADRNAAEFNLASPVARISGSDIYYGTVRGWTDAECRGAWNHVMDNTPSTGRLTDRPSGRQYTPRAGRGLRDRLNKINGADADRGEKA